MSEKSEREETEKYLQNGYQMREQCEDSCSVRFMS